MSYTTKVSKDFMGKQWRAETSIQLQQENRVLKVSTFKSLRGVLYTSCQAMKVENHMESFMLHGDYKATVKQFPALTRVNEKVITQAHNESLSIIDQFVKEANEFYAVGEGAELAG